MNEEKKNKIKKISRRDALMKAGKYAAITSVTAMMVLSPKKAAAASEEPASPEPWSEDDVQTSETWWLP